MKKQIIVSFLILILLSCTKRVPDSMTQPDNKFGHLTPFFDDEEFFDPGHARVSEISDERNTSRDDMGFGSPVTFTIGSADDTVRAVAMSKDGAEKLFVAGRISNGATGNDFFVGKLESIGIWDEKFSSDGWTTTDFGSNGDEVAHAIAWQTDGKVILGGRGYNGSNFDFALARYRTNGALDTGFDTDGKKLHTIGGGGDFIRALIFQTNGKIVAGGYTYNASHYDFAASRYSNDGTLDTTFGTGGVGTVDIVLNRDDVGTSVAVMSDGRVVVAGASYNASNNWDVSIVRFNTVGAIDSTFASGSAVTTTVGAEHDILWTVTLDSNEKIIAAGEANMGTNTDMLLMRYVQAGVLDTLFSTDGVVTSTLSSAADVARSVLIDSKGKINIVGSTTGSKTNFAMWKFHTNGSSDTSFGTNGAIVQTLSANEDSALAGGVGDTDRIYAAGKTSNGTNYDLGLFRVTENGAAYNWVQQAYIKAPSLSASDNFGHKVAIDGNTLVVGVSEEDSSSTTIINGTDAATDNGLDNVGAVYVYTRSGSAWGQQAYIKAPIGDSADAFGEYVGISGDTIVVSSQGEDSGGNTIIAGPGGGSTDNAASSVGAAYVFVRTGSEWSQQAFLKPSSVSNVDNFGSDVAIDGDNIVVGARNDDSTDLTIITGSTAPTDNSSTNIGAAYVFTRTGSEWAQTGYLKPAYAGSQRFGRTVAISGNTVIVGAAEDRSAIGGIINGTGGPTDWATGNYGAAYVFVKGGTGWYQEAYIKPPNAAAFSGDQFTSNMSFHKDTLAVGVNLDETAGAGVSNGSTAGTATSGTSTGTAYIFIRSGSEWALQSFIKHPAPKSSDAFAESIAVRGDIAVVGFPGEDSDDVTSNGSIASTSVAATDSGAAFVYFRSGTQWYHKGILKSPSVTSSQLFGSHVAIYNDTVIVGEEGDDANVTGIFNGTSASTLGGTADSGAVYIFTK